jgi:hypothetical protein
MKAKLVLLSILVVVALAVILPTTAMAKGPGTVGATVFDAKLMPTNAPPVAGELHLVLNPRAIRLRVMLHVWGIRDNMLHTAAITGFTSGQPARLPTPAYDANKDGIISGAEAAVAVGDPLVWLEPIKVKRNGKIVFYATLTNSQLAALSPIDIMLGKCAIVVYGVMQQPTYGLPFYDPTAPLTSGLIKAKKAI